MKKEKIEQNPETFKVVKPEKPKARMPKFFKIIIGLIVILAVLFIFWELYQVYEMNSNIDESTYDGVSTISDSNVQAGSTLIQKIDIENIDKFNLSILERSTSDGLKYQIYRGKNEYDKFLAECGYGKKLTDSDFTNFFVLVAYKENKELNLDSRYSGMNYDNIVLTEESNANAQILLLVIPKAKEKDVNVLIKQGEKIFLDTQDDVVEKINNNLNLITEYFSRKYFESQNLSNATILIKDVKLVNDKANEFFITKGDLQEPTGEVTTYWQAYVYLEQNTKYILKILVDCESGELVGAYDLTK